MGEVSGVLSQTVNALGQTIRTVVDSAGSIFSNLLLPLSLSFPPLDPSLLRCLPLPLPLPFISSPSPLSLSPFSLSPSPPLPLSPSLPLSLSPSLPLPLSPSPPLSPCLLFYTLILQDIIDQTLGSTGQVVSQTISGNLNALQIITSATNALGQYVTRVRNSDGSVYDIMYLFYYHNHLLFLFILIFQ